MVEVLPGVADQGRRFGPQAEIKTSLVHGDPEAARGTQIVEVSLPPMVKQTRRTAEDGAGGNAPVAGESEMSRRLDDSVEWLRLFYARMPKPDRLALWTLLAAVLGCFCPWWYVLGEGLLAGIQTPWA